MAGPADRVRHVACPRCGHPAVYSAANKFRPFCSERCRLIDLGQWATESYRIPADAVSEEDQPDSKS